MKLAIRDFNTEIYLDTNIISGLLKGELSYDLLKSKLDSKNGFISLSPYTLLELQKKPILVKRLIDFTVEFPCVMVTHGKEEVTGKSIEFQSWYESFFELRLTDKTLISEFISCINSDFFTKSIKPNFKEELKNYILNAKKLAISDPKQGRWSKLDKFIARYIKNHVESKNTAFVETALKNKNCYRGLKLQAGYLFEKFYISNKEWQDSDSLDLLHMKEMAYAKIIYTERSNKHTLMELINRIEGIEPNEILSIDSLRYK